MLYGMYSKLKLKAIVGLYDKTRALLSNSAILHIYWRRIFKITSYVKRENLFLGKLWLFKKQNGFSHFFSIFHQLSVCYIHLRRLLQKCSLHFFNLYIPLKKVLKFKALSHGAIFLTTCNAILHLGDVKLANTCSITVC